MFLIGGEGLDRATQVMADRPLTATLIRPICNSMRRGRCGSRASRPHPTVHAITYEKSAPSECKQYGQAKSRILDRWTKTGFQRNMRRA